jgi:site-specific DNA-methyltransferase (adenine-specific)
VGFYYLGNVIIAKPGEICTESWIVAGAFDTEKETKNFRSYLFTKVVRFLLLQAVISQDVTRKNFMFVPHLGKYDRKYTDEFLVTEWGINKSDWDYIDSRITKVIDDK